MTVTVNQTLTSIAVNPGLVTIGTGDTEAFTATAKDQFGNAMSPAPSFTWSVVSGGGTIGASSGVYNAPTLPGSATIEATSGGKSATASVTIAPSSRSATVTYANTGDWGTGFTGSIGIKNTGAKTINGWTLAFDFTPTITSIWGATIVSHSGTHYVIQNASYDGTIAPGQAVSFGFNGTPGGAFKPPTNYVLNGVAVGTPTPPPPSPLKAAVSFTDVNDWGTGFTGSLTITNTGTTAIQGWTLQFDFGATLTSIWNANLLGQSGTTFKIQDAGYNAVINPGQSVTFGFNGTPGHVLAGPTNYVLNGVRLG